MSRQADERNSTSKTNSGFANGQSSSPSTNNASETSGKRLARRSSKPIINWFQRKLAGKPQRNITPPSKTSVPVQNTVSPGTNQGSRTSNTNGNSGITKDGTVRGNRNLKPDLDSNGADEFLSINRGSLYSPSNRGEADEDASVRPIAPSAPPSPSNSFSSSSILSDPKTFRSATPSTKPTTVMSIDAAPPSVGHIAQVPSNLVVSPDTSAPRFLPHVRTPSFGANSGVGGLSSAASITFSTLPPTSPDALSESFVQSSAPTDEQLMSLQAPLHTAPHPRNNPRPSSPPLDNASVLTLASSAYAMPTSRVANPRRGWSSTAASTRGDESMLGTSMLGDGDATSQFEDRLDVDGERDFDASVRALRPRSSRHNSWESEASGWSAVVGRSVPQRTDTPTRSVWTSNSFRSGNGDETEDMDTPASPSVYGATSPTRLEITDDIKPPTESTPTETAPIDLVEGKDTTDNSDKSQKKRRPRTATQADPLGMSASTATELESSIEDESSSTPHISQNPQDIQ